VTADQTNRLPQIVNRRLNRSATYPPIGLRKAYTHLNWPSMNPQLASDSIVGTSAMTDDFIAAIICRSR
jgi:hypothetical protein